MEIKKVSTGFLEPVLSSDIKIKVLSHVRHNEIVENIGAYLPSTIERLPLPKTSVSHKRKVSFDMCTSTPSIKKQAMQPCTSFSSQNISLPNNMADELFTSLTNSTITNESGYCSFETQNSQSMTN